MLGLDHPFDQPIADGESESQEALPRGERVYRGAQRKGDVAQDALVQAVAFGVEHGGSSEEHRRESGDEYSRPALDIPRPWN